MANTSSPYILEYWPTEKLIPYANNARTHTPEQIQQIAASITEFGFTNPVLADRAGGIIAGHGRVLAAQALQLREVPVIVLGHLSEAQRKAYIIADNKIAMNAGWDEDLLTAELKELEEIGYPLELTGFQGEELDDVLKGLDGTGSGTGNGDGAATSGDWKPEDHPVSAPGDVWLLGPHSIAVAEESSARRYLIDEAVRFWQEAAGGKAKLNATGQTFDDVAKDRGVVTA